MAENFIKLPQYVEPLTSNRWLVCLDESLQKIPAYLFNNFKLETVAIKDNKKVKQSLKLTLNCYNTTDFLLTPDDVINTKKVMIEFLDPTGVKINHYDMKVELDKMSLLCDYSDSSLMTHEIVFWVKELNLMSINGDVEKETFNNYKKNK